MNFPKSNQQAGVLILMLIFAAILGTSLAGILIWAQQETKMTVRSKAWNAALPLAESGIEEALAHLAFTNNLISSGWQILDGKVTKTRQLGSDYFVTTIGTNNSAVDIISRGFVKLPLTSTQFVTRTVQITVTNEPLFKAAILLKSTLKLSGYDLVVDSYNSQDPNRSSAGVYDPGKRNHDGHIMSILGIINKSPAKNKSVVYGKLNTGVGGSLEIGNLGAVGSSGWHYAGNLGIEPSWHSNNMRYTFPEIKAPIGAFPASGGMVDGKDYQYVLPTGKWATDQITGSVYVSGHASLIVTDSINIYDASDAIVVAPGASLKIFMQGGWSVIGGGGVTNQTGKPVNFQYYGAKDHYSITLNTPELTGLIYAPHSVLSVGASGKSLFTLYGAAVASEMKLQGEISVHFDEAAQEVPSPIMKISSWREL